MFITDNSIVIFKSAYVFNVIMYVQGKCRLLCKKRLTLYLIGKYS